MFSNVKRREEKNLSDALLPVKHYLKASITYRKTKENNYCLFYRHSSRTTTNEREGSLWKCVESISG